MGYTRSDRAIDVADDEDARAIVDEYLPNVFESPLLRFLPMITIGSIARGPLFAGELGDGLDRMWAELAALPSNAPRRRMPPEPPAPRATFSDDISTRSDVEVRGDLEQWGLVELALRGPESGNPFTEIELGARFASPEHPTEVVVGGFYDGDGIYRLRFQPPHPGTWSYVTTSNAASLHGHAGEMAIQPASAGNHGPVQVADTFHFAYADGTRFAPFGTTLYAWTHQPEEVEQRTLRTLETSPFNKVRMCVFPKSYLYNTEEPSEYPYAKGADGSWDFSRFNPAFFQHLEARILDLQRRGIESDLILFHAYDRWGFSEMPAWADDLYLRYLVRRLGALRSIWWSFANEYDLLYSKHEQDWERFAHVVQTEDHADHLRSIHNCFSFYDHTRPWITHCSIQRVDLYKTSENTDRWREDYGKPIIIDEVGYEGDIDQGWGNLSPQELVRRSWEACIRGGYVTHGETYYNKNEELWWSKGGELVGESAPRIAFLRDLVADAPAGVLEPLAGDWDARWGGSAHYRLIYFGFERPSFRTIAAPAGQRWRVEVIDTWAMTLEELPGVFEGTFKVELPGREYMALRLRKDVPVE